MQSFINIDVLVSYKIPNKNHTDIRLLLLGSYSVTGVYSQRHFVPTYCILLPKVYSAFT